MASSGVSLFLSIMGFSSINTLLSHTFQPQFFTSKYRNHVFYTTHKPQLSLSHHSISSNSVKSISCCQISPPLPISKTITNPLPVSIPVSPPKKPHNDDLFQKLALLVAGSLVLMQCLGLKTVPALTVQNGGSVMSEKMETQQNEGIEDDEEMNMEKTPKNVDALKVLVYGFMRKGKTKKAVECVEKLIDIEPNEVEWRLLQAICYDMMGQLSKAKRLFIEILEERPLLIKALHGLAMIMHKNHEGPALFEMLDKALEVAYREKRVTEERNIKILIAQMHVVKGELETGLMKLQDLVEENPRDFRPYLCQGIVYSLLEKKEEAEEQFKTYRSLVPEEFPQRGFLDDAVLTAKIKSRELPKKKR